MTEFKNSQTKENLMRAFAGESQARNRYTFAGAMAKKNGLYVIEYIFNFTAMQEAAHAKVYYDSLKEVTGGNINVDGNYPVDIHDSIIALLRSAQHNEYQEYEHDYAEFARIAKEEGFDKISNTFRMIADVERTHGERFEQFADMLENKTLFVSDVETQWMCLNCGYISKGKVAPQVCPVCFHDQGYFIRVELAPFSKK